MELSNGSNGWFRFILDGKLATMYSSGSPEGGSDSSENRGEFLEKLQRARALVKTGISSQPVLTKSGTTRIMVGNWSLTCKKDGELHIHNSDGQQVGYFTWCGTKDFTVSKKSSLETIILKFLCDWSLFIYVAS